MRSLIATFVALLFFTFSGRPQSCAPPPIVINSKAENIFSPEQEMWLGDAMMERLEKDFRVINDDSVNAYLQKIGDRISKHLPVTGISFRLVVIDIPDTNAYAMAGGRIFVTRKMLSFVRSEDELAAVIGHELGHAVVRHNAIDISRYFKELLGVSSVGDRRDVFEKYNRYLETSRTKRVKFASGHMDDKQIEADRIGVFAVYAAGYDPGAMTSFWKRLTDARKRGFFSAAFGEKKNEDTRLQEMTDAMKQIPPGCQDKLVGSTKNDFEKWRTFVINYSGLGTKESLDGLIYRRSLVPLRGDIEHLRFSPNGDYILAQDNSTVTILRREPLSVVFRVDIEDAFPASFSSDSKMLIVYNKNLRVQKWNILEKNLVSTNEIAIRGGYWQTRISPDGNHIACYRYNGDLVVYDVATNDEIFKEKDFYVPRYIEYVVWREWRYNNDSDDFPVLNLEFSPDGKYFLAGRKFTSYTYETSQEKTLAVDLTTRKTVPIGANIRKLLVSAMDFMGPDRVIGQYGDDLKKSGVFEFPSGNRIDQFEMSGESFMPAEKGEFVTVRPVSRAAVGIYDLKAKKFVLANKRAALDVYENTFVAERRNGEIALYSIGTDQPLAKVSLAASPLGNIRTWSISPDGSWLTISDRSRGAVWNLRTGERVQHLRSFRGSYIAPDGKVYADFPKQGDMERTIAIMDLQNGTVTPGESVTSEHNVRQHGPYLIVRRPLKNKKEKKEEQEGEKTPYTDEERDKEVADREILMEVRDIKSNAVLWTREFPDERPNYSISPAQDTMVLSWYLSKKAAKDIIKNDQSLSEKVKSMDEKAGDRLIQLINPKTGSITGNFLLETGEGSFHVELAVWAGDYLVIEDEHNRILVYSSVTGQLLNRFFGKGIAISSTAGKIAIENTAGRVTIYELGTGKELQKLSFTRPVTIMRFLDNGSQLFVLTSDQIAFLFDATKFQGIAGRAS